MAEGPHWGEKGGWWEKEREVEGVEWGGGKVGVEVEEWAQGGRRETMRAHRHRAPRSAQTETRTLVYHVILWDRAPAHPLGLGAGDSLMGRWNGLQLAVRR